MMGKRKIVNSVLLHVVLAVLAVIWITPIVWLIVTSFSGYDGMNTEPLLPGDMVDPQLYSYAL